MGARQDVRWSGRVRPERARRRWAGRPPGGRSGGPLTPAARPGGAQVCWSAVAAARVGSAPTGPPGPVGPPSSASTSWRAVGRRAGSLASADSTSRRSGPASTPRSGAPCRIRCACSVGDSDGPDCACDHGLCPVAAYATRLPQLNTSAAGPTVPFRNCSGAIHPGVPTSIPAWVCRLATSSARAMPKSITRGPDSERSTLAGFRSRCTTPAACTAESAAATPSATPCNVDSSNGPPSDTATLSGTPSTNSVTRYGARPAGSASSTRAVQNGATRRAAATSSANRARNSGSAASSACTTFTATGGPPASARPR